MSTGRAVLRFLAPGLLVFAIGCSHGPEPTGPDPAPPSAKDPASGIPLTGFASYYASSFHGRRTASGETYNQNALTAAHRTLPFGSRLRVTEISSGKSVEVRINDRGPFRKDRIVDLSRRAAEELGFVAAGLTRVRIEVLDDRDEGDDDDDD